MPSGAKKRKAAKKKKEKESKQINPNSNSPLQNDDQSSHDKSESEDGVSSRSSSDHEKNEESPREFTTTEVSGNAEVFGKSGVEDEGSITIQHEPKADQNVETADSAHSSSSSSSSSDDESHETEKENNQDSAVEPIQHGDLDEPEISLQENVGEVAVNATLPDTTANVILETVPVDESSKPLVSETKEQTSLVALTENSSEVPDDVKQVLIENVERIPDAAASGSSGTMVKDLSISDENSIASSAVTGIVVKEYTDETLTLSNPAVELTNTSENVQEPRISESAKERPSPLVAQRTSWLSCCGLLDVVTGSGR